MRALGWQPRASKTVVEMATSSWLVGMTTAEARTATPPSCCRTGLTLSLVATRDRVSRLVARLARWMVVGSRTSCICPARVMNHRAVSSRVTWVRLTAMAPRLTTCPWRESARPTRVARTRLGQPLRHPARLVWPAQRPVLAGTRAARLPTSMAPPVRGIASCAVTSPPRRSAWLPTARDSPGWV